jgi:hypothetical protein
MPDVPAVALDAEGQTHVLWAEYDAQGAAGSRLYYARGDMPQNTTPAYVIESLDGRVKDPSLVALGDRLHLVWSGGANGRIYYSQCFARDAGSRAGWSEPVSLPEPPGAGGLGGWPRIVADGAGILHVVYSVPANEARGIYYTRSTDGGLTWQPARAACDAAQQGWASVAYPDMAVGTDGALHAVWVLTSLSVSSMPEAIYYARSTDSGETWSAPLGVAFGSHTWPAVAALATGDVHVIWRDLSREGVWSHIRSTDGRQWRIVGQPQGFRGIAGRAVALSDGVGSIHLLGVERSDGSGPVLRHSLWQTATERWTAQDDQPLGIRFDPLGGLGATLAPEAGTLTVALPAQWLVDDSEQSGLLQLRRAVQPVKLPEAVVRTDLTPVATAMPEPTATPRPTPTVPSGAPAPSAAIGVGPLTLPYAGLAGLALVAVLVSAVVISFRLRSASRYRR